MFAFECAFPSLFDNPKVVKSKSVLLLRVALLRMLKMFFCLSSVSVAAFLYTGFRIDKMNQAGLEVTAFWRFCAFLFLCIPAVSLVCFLFYVYQPGVRALSYEAYGHIADREPVDRFVGDVLNRYAAVVSFSSGIDLSEEFLRLNQLLFQYVSARKGSGRDARSVELTLASLRTSIDSLLSSLEGSDEDVKFLFVRRRALMASFVSKLSFESDYSFSDIIVFVDSLSLSMLDSVEVLAPSVDNNFELVCKAFA